jgi:hypothetical protein
MKLSKYHLALLSMLIPVGFSLIGIFYGTKLLPLAYLVIMVGALSFGSMLAKK